MSIRTISEDEVAPGVIVAVVEITEPGEDKRLVYEVSCEACDTLEVGLNYAEANAEAQVHREHQEEGS